MPGSDRALLHRFLQQVQRPPGGGLALLRRAGNLEREAVADELPHSLLDGIIRIQSRGQAIETGETGADEGG